MKKSSWILFLLAALFSGFGLPAAAQEAAPRTFEVQHVRQVCYPYLQHVTETSFTVIWTTNIDALSWVEVAPDDGTHFYNCERPKYYDLRGLGRRPIGRVHKVTVSGLEPGTTYRYRIMMQGVLDQDNRRSIVYGEGYGLDLRKHPTKVTTKRAAYDKLEFAVVNDMHEHDSVLRADFKDAKGKYDFVVFNGRSMQFKELDANIKRLAASSTKSTVLVRCTLDSHHEDLVHVLDICNKYKMYNLSIFSM